MIRALIAAVILFFISGALPAQDVAGAMQPQITGFSVAPARVGQCRPVRINIIIRNQSDKPICSQRPCSGATYNLYQTFQDKGFAASPDRYMVGISLNGGQDGYPYRWGFRGPLGSGRSTSIMGFLSLIEVGTYNLTASLLLGDTPLGATRIGAVKVHDSEPGQFSDDPSPAEAICAIINGLRLPRMTPYMQDGYMLVALKPLVRSIGASLDFTDNSAVISKPGLEIALFPGSRQALVNGIPVHMPTPVHVFNGVTYVPIRYVSPLLAQTFYWYPDSRILFMDGSGAS